MTPSPGKLLGARAAVERIADGATVAVLGAGGGIVEPGLLMEALGERFRETGRPAGITLVHTTGLGDRDGRGTEALAQRGLLRRVIAGHFGMCPQVAALVEADEVEAYNLPLGVFSVLLREIAAGRPGLLTTIGLGTFADPRNEGCRMNAVTPPGLVEVVELQGRELLFYPSFPIDVAFVRGTYGDADGYLSLAGETSYLDAYELAAAAKASKGLVIAQVKRVVERATLPPKEAIVPGILVDTVVEHPGQWQTYAGEHDPAYAGQVRVPRRPRTAAFDHRKVIARRAALEIARGDVVNLGVGIPDGVAAVLDEDGVLDEVTFTVEHGVIGGVTAPGAIFGATANARAVIPMPAMIDYYHAGGLDIAFLGFAQLDGAGNVNVSRFGATVMGSGGFVDIAQHTPCVVFCGTLTAGGLDVSYAGGRFALTREGRQRKAVARVDQITFSGERALASGQRVLYVTDRALFELTADGVALREVAPGVDVARDVLDVCDFAPVVDERALGTFPAAVLDERPLGLRERWAEAPA